MLHNFHCNRAPLAPGEIGSYQQYPARPYLPPPIILYHPPLQQSQTPSSSFLEHLIKQNEGMAKGWMRKKLKTKNWAPSLSGGRLANGEKQTIVSHLEVISKEGASLTAAEICKILAFAWGISLKIITEIEANKTKPHQPASPTSNLAHGNANSKKRKKELSPRSNSMRTSFARFLSPRKAPSKIGGPRKAAPTTPTNQAHGNDKRKMELSPVGRHFRKPRTSETPVSTWQSFVRMLSPRKAAWKATTPTKEKKASDHQGRRLFPSPPRKPSIIIKKPQQLSNPAVEKVVERMQTRSTNTLRDGLRS
jgi:hypothetical protein